MYRIQVARNDSPVMTLRWHPKIPNTVVTATASGFLSSWHTETGQRLWQFEESENNVNCIDISPDGSTFTTVGSDKIVRLYELQTRKQLATMQTRAYMQGTVSGHEGRVFACHYITPTLIASSGWDDTVILWDTRSSEVTNSISGVHICGDAIKNAGDVLITGSWRSEKQLQFWDLPTGQNLHSVTIGKKAEALFVYGLALSHDKTQIGVCGSEMNQAQFYRISDYFKVGRTETFDSCVSAIDFSSSNKYAIGLANSKVYVDQYTLNQRE